MKLLITNLVLMLVINSEPLVENLTSIYDQNIAIKDLYGKDIDLNKFKGKKLLIVNVASECGFTPQYEGLQKLYETYGDKLEILGVPCNQFGGQEPGSSEQIGSFCKENYGVEFTISEKTEVKGDSQHDLYKWLTSKERNGLKSSNVKWNFQKYLLDEDGKLIDYFSSMTKPNSDKITQHLK